MVSPSNLTEIPGSDESNRMVSKANRGWFGLMPVLILLASCATQKVSQIPAEAVFCSDPRPQICTMDYRPVCATRDNGRQCLTTPCDSSENATYANACGACSDARVLYHLEGACSE